MNRFIHRTRFMRYSQPGSLAHQRLVAKPAIGARGKAAYLWNTGQAGAEQAFGAVAYSCNR